MLSLHLASSSALSRLVVPCEPDDIERYTLH
jgi:hypothetical protein